MSLTSYTLISEKKKQIYIHICIYKFDIIDLCSFMVIQPNNSCYNIFKNGNNNNNGKLKNTKTRNGTVARAPIPKPEVTLYS